MPAKVGSKTVRLDPHSCIRLERIRQELQRRAREGRDLGAELDFSLAAVHRTMLGKGLDYFERYYKLPELPEPEGLEDSEGEEGQE